MHAEKFFDLAELGRAPLAVEAVRRIDVLFAIERDLIGLPAGERLAQRQLRSDTHLGEFEAWMRQTRAKLSRHADVAKAMDYMLTRWESFARFLGDGRIDLSNNTAERALRGIAIGRKAWLFAGSDRGGERAAAIYSVITTAKLNDVGPRAWLADVLARINDHPAARLDDLLPWNWKAARSQAAA
jgi:transposase